MTSFDHQMKPRTQDEQVTGGQMNQDVDLDQVWSYSGGLSKKYVLRLLKVITIDWSWIQEMNNLILSSHKGSYVGLFISLNGNGAHLGESWNYRVY